MSIDLSVRPLPALAALALAATTAHATWSIVLIDTRTGEVALGSATCLTSFDLQANTPTLLTGIGGSTAQSFVDQSGANKTIIRDQLLLGTPPDVILDILETNDPGHQTRQYGIGDTMGGTATFSGTGAGEWAGGVVGQFGDVVYAIQGNVLTGEPVVTMAEQAVIDTPGDLAEKLMAGMEAARLMGGDGRCSCAPNDPTGCGSPPDNFEKSAHIAYMLIARTGDKDLCNPSYRVGSAAWDTATADLNGDGLPDAVFADSLDSNVRVFLNGSTFGGDVLVLQPPLLLEAPSNHHDVLLEDVTGDGVIDVISGNFLDDSVSVFPGIGDGTFGERSDFPAGNGPENMVLVDVTGDGIADLVCADSVGFTVTVLPGDGAGNFGAPIQSPGGSQASDLAPIDFDGDGDMDLAVAARADDVITFLINDGAGNFALTSLLQVADAPNTLVADDFDDDGDVDLAVGHMGVDPVVTIALSKPGFFSYDTFEVESVVRPAFLVAGSSVGSGLGVLKGLPNGQFEADGAYATLGTVGGISLEDLDLDGDIDVVVSSRNPGAALLVTGLGGLVLNGELGCGQGDHWMEFNVAFQTSRAPDPVFQLMDMFEVWRDDLVGRPDAVQSLVDFSPAAVIADGASTVTMTISLLDWQLDPISVDIESVVVEHAPGSPGGSQIGQVVDEGAGVYSVEITSPETQGEEAYQVTVDDGVRPVILMPDPALFFLIDPDFNGDGAKNVFDFVAFQTAFQNGDPAADANADGLLDVFDFVAFSEAFQAF